MRWVELNEAIKRADGFRVAVAEIFGIGRHQLRAGRPGGIGMLTLNGIEVFHRAGVVALAQVPHAKGIEHLRFLIGRIGGDAPRERGVRAGARLLGR
jgi:hypothetical protein